VVYPVLPSGTVDRWNLIDPRAAWVSVVLIAALGFVNYILLNLYGARGIEFTGFLGGLVNSTVTVTELATRVREGNGQLADVAYRGIVLATAAMLVRNGIILGLLAPDAFASASGPLALMLAGAVVAALWDRRRHLAQSDEESGQPRIASAPPSVPVMTSPFSLASALRFGLIFLALQIAATLAERYLGEAGLYALSVAGGVVSIFTEDGPPIPFVQGQVIGGSFGTWNAIAKLGGQTQGLNYMMAANHFETEGYRDHSTASRDQFNSKLKFALDSDTRVTLIGNTLYQPEALDPLGLTRAELQANRRGVDPAATLFDTRKTVGQQQGGATIERSVGADTILRLTGYAGHRAVRQYLALSGIGDTSSGGVTDLDGNFGGIDARVTTRFTLGGGPLSLTVGAAYDRQEQARKGYVNNNGELGDLRRDEDDTVHDQDVYAQAEWSPLESLSLLAGVRSGTRSARPRGGANASMAASVGEIRCSTSDLRRRRERPLR